MILRKAAAAFLAALCIAQGLFGVSAREAEASEKKKGIPSFSEILSGMKEKDAFTPGGSEEPTEEVVSCTAEFTQNDHSGGVFFLKGRVSPEETGGCKAEAFIWCENEETDGYLYRTRTDADGSFSFICNVRQHAGHTGTYTARVFLLQEEAAEKDPDTGGGEAPKPPWLFTAQEKAGSSAVDPGIGSLAQAPALPGADGKNARQEGSSGEALPDPAGISEAEEDEGKLLLGEFSGTVLVREKEYHEAAETEVPVILQRPELPTGCESVSLTIVLTSLGFTPEKTTIADEYLTFGTNFTTDFVGDPHSENAAGVFPPGLVHAANRYLKDQHSTLRAWDTSETSLEDLYAFIDEGTPVIVWHTMYGLEPVFPGDTAWYNGKMYSWYHVEHCIVLYGYDRNRGVVKISDPLEGKVERNAEDFERLFDLTGRYSMVIREEKPEK